MSINNHQKLTKMDSSKNEDFRCLKELIEGGESIGNLSKIVHSNSITRRGNLLDEFGNSKKESSELHSKELEKVKTALYKYHQLEIDSKNMVDASETSHSLNEEWPKLSFENTPTNVYICYGYFKDEFEGYKRQLDLKNVDRDEFHLLKPSQTANKENLIETERTSLLKMILGMAIKKYRYEPGKSKNEATGDGAGSILSDLDRIGIKIDSGTIRKYLKEAEDKVDFTPK